MRGLEESDLSAEQFVSEALGGTERVQGMMAARIGGVRAAMAILARSPIGARSLERGGTDVVSGVVVELERASTNGVNGCRIALVWVHLSCARA